MKQGSLFCSECHRVNTMCICNPTIENESSENKKLNFKQNHSIRRGGSKHWIFFRNGSYNYYADRLKRCSLWYEKNDLNIKNLGIGDNVLMYCNSEFIASGIISSVKTNVRFSQIDCTIDEIDIPDFSFYGNVIELKNVEVFDPDNTVDIHPLLFELSFIRGQLSKEKLLDFINKNQWSIRVATSIRSIEREDYNLIINKFLELKEKKMDYLQNLRQYLIKKDNSICLENMSGRLFELLGKPEWLLDSEKYITKNGIKIMKNKLAKVGINYNQKDDLIEIEDLQEGEYLNGDGNRYPLFGYGRMKMFTEYDDEILEDRDIQKLSELKDEILNGKIKLDGEGYLIRV